MSDFIRFVDKNNSTFYSTLKARVEEYFKKNNLSKSANGLMYFKSFLYIGGMVTLYALLYTGWFSLWQMLGIVIFLGIFKALIGFNVSHDAIHGAYSSKEWVNKLMSGTFYLIGANPYVWRITHNTVHHMYTNIPEHDEDLEIAPMFIRLCDAGKKYKIQRFQHLYAFLLYGLASISWVFRKDFVKFFKKKIGHFDFSKKPAIEYFNLFFFKAVYYTLYVVFPLMFLEITWWQYLIGLFAMHLSMGLVLGLVFQLAHVVEGISYPRTNEEGNIEDAWAAHQMRTTANFGTKDRLTGFICGGLNNQIEHHLFPKVCHVHYPAISDIVKQTAKEYGLPYIENKSFFTALASHYKMLKLFGPEAQKKINTAKVANTV
ncbi:MAG: acyl-CoA desaturase [Cytophagaceae bacterium]|nr:acyl-CoA desaturase [Cytophagaceae bacterium]MDW8456782.1 acyl-CoA desaturase [Cytophagaceae bacterium]